MRQEKGYDYTHCTAWRERQDGSAPQPRKQPVRWLCTCMIIMCRLSMFLQAETAGMTNALGIPLVSSLSLHQNPPYELFQGKPWHANPVASFVRLDVYFDAPTRLGGIKVTFEKPVDRPVTFHLNDLEKVIHMVPANKVAEVDINYPQKVSTVKINFEGNDSIAIQEIMFLDSAKKTFKIKTCRAVTGNVIAASTRDPNRIYHAMKLFDSRQETAWSSKKKTGQDTLTFTFKRPQGIKALILWNGNQLSDIHYLSTGRIRRIFLEGSSGYSHSIAVRDTLGGQTIELPKKFTGTLLRMIITERYPGTDYEETALSELRFFDGTDYVIIDPREAVNAEKRYNIVQFSKGRIQSLLDAQANGYYGNFDSFVFRFRSDGSIFVKVINNKGPNPEKCFALGNYEILKSAKDSTNLRLSGFIITEQGEGGFQGADCGGLAYMYKGAAKRIFTEYVTIRPMEIDKNFIIVNTSKQKNINFDENKLSTD
jgi:hypothetical protein